jgi:hypothetical protein
VIRKQVPEAPVNTRVEGTERKKMSYAGISPEEENSEPEWTEDWTGHEEQ